MDAADDVLAEVIDSFNQRAARYDESEMHRGLAERVAAFVELDGVETLLDVATGTGLLLRALRPTHSIALIGVDASPGMLAVARRHLPEARLIEADVSRLPLGDASVDLITCVTALHIFQRPHEVLSEWARVLAPAGRIVTATFEGRSWSGNPLANHADYADAATLARTFEPFGFAVARHENWQHGEHDLLIADLARAV